MGADVSALIRDTVKHPGMAAQRLVTEALTRGSADNVSAAVVFVGGGQLGARFLRGGTRSWGAPPHSVPAGEGKLSIACPGRDDGMRLNSCLKKYITARLRLPRRARYSRNPRSSRTAGGPR